MAITEAVARVANPGKARSTRPPAKRDNHERVYDDLISSDRRREVVKLDADPVVLKLAPVRDDILAKPLWSVDNMARPSAELSAYPLTLPARRHRYLSISRSLCSKRRNPQFH